MAVYEYEHNDEGCKLGKMFEWEQSIKTDALKKCPECGEPITRLISRTFISTPQTNSELKNLGFTKLEKRDTGVYENMTRRGNDSRYMEADKPETIPDLKKTITD